MKPLTIARKVAAFYHAKMMKHAPGSAGAKLNSLKSCAAEEVVLCMRKPSLIKNFRIEAPKKTRRSAPTRAERK